MAGTPSSETNASTPTAVGVEISDDTLAVELADGRTISVPIAWYPRLLHGTPQERGRWRLIGQGHGIHWPDLDEDVSVENLLAGSRSSESQESLRRWLDERSGRGTSRDDDGRRS